MANPYVMKNYIFYTKYIQNKIRQIMCPTNVIFVNLIVNMD